MKQTLRADNRASAQNISSNLPLIIGHRGASAAAPENTVAAFARAFDDGADGIELDVRLARDGVPVVIHDATLQRTGLRGGTVSRMTSAELENVDVGSWFNRAHPTLAQTEYGKARVPTLERVFDLCRQYRGAIYVELKTDQRTSTDDCVQSVSEVIRRFEFQSRVMLVSFNLELIATAKSLDAAIRTGALFTPRRGVNAWRGDKILSAALEAGADEILLHRLLARPRLVEKCIERGLPVVVWTVNDPKWLPRGQALGIRGLITNRPAALRVARDNL